MGGRPDPIRIVDAAYRWEPDERAWLEGLVETCRGYDIGAGIVGYLVRSDTETQVTTMLGTASDADTRAFHDVLSGFSPALARQALAPTEFEERRLGHDGSRRGGVRTARVQRAVLPRARGRQRHGELSAAVQPAGVSRRHASRPPPMPVAPMAHGGLSISGFPSTLAANTASCHGLKEGCVSVPPGRE